MKTILSVIIAFLFATIAKGQTYAADLAKVPVANSFEQAIQLGDKAFAVEHWVDALGLYQQAIAFNPQERKTYSNYLALCFDLGKKLYYQTEGDFFKQQISVITALIKKNPKSALLYSTRSSLYTQEKTAIALENALNDIGVAIKLKPTDSIFYFKRANYYNTNSDHSKNKGVAALLDVDKAIALGFEQSMVYRLRKEIVGNLGNNDQTFETFKKAINSAQNNNELAQVYVSRGMFYEDFEKKEQAFADYTKAIELAKGKSNVAQEKIEQLNRKIAGFASANQLPSPNVTKFEDATSSYSDLLNKVNAYIYGFGETKEVNPTKALACSNEAIRIYPNIGDGYLSRGMANYKAGHNQNALDDFAKARTLNPGFGLKFIERLKAAIDGKEYVDPDWVETTSTYVATTQLYNSERDKKEDNICPECNGTGKVKSAVPTYTNVTTTNLYPSTRITTTSTASFYPDITCPRCSGSGKKHDW